MKETLARIAQGVGLLVICAAVAWAANGVTGVGGGSNVRAGFGDGGYPDPTALHSNDGGTTNVGGQFAAKNSTIAGAETVLGNLQAGQIKSGDGGVTALGGVLSAQTVNVGTSTPCLVSGGAACTLGNTQIRFLPTAGSFFNVGPTLSTAHLGLCVPQSAGAACTAATDNYLHVTSGIWILNGNTDVRLAIANVSRVTVVAATTTWAASNTIVAGSTGNKGSVPLVGGTLAVTVISGAVCNCNNTTTAATPCKMPVSGTTATITSGVTTDTVSYLCL